MFERISGACTLTHLGVIRAQGEDAIPFLQGQLTNDVALQQPSQARLAAWCSAKGRMLASFVVVRLAADDLLLICSRDLLAPTLKRLSMFVLRAKVRLSDASATFALHGLLGDAARAVQALPTWAVGRGALNADADVAEGSAAVITIALPAAPAMPRALRVAPAGTPAPAVAALDESAWLWAEVHSGVARVQAAVVDAFVPQMLNYESVDGINFRKGCYPGQEVVARSQFRGAIKRRGFIVRCETVLTPGQELFDPQDLSQPCGVVAMAAAVPTGCGADGACDAIASLQVSTALSPALVTADGTAVQTLPLPYPLRTDI